MIVGASHGSLGSSRAQAHMRQILDSPELKARIMPGTEFLLGRSLQAFDDAGNLIDENKVKELEEDFQEFALFAEMTNKLMADDRFATQQERKFTWEMLGEA
jgi:NAD(P)H-dependent FMN reductase